jgi:hypothetical protein
MSQKTSRAWRIKETVAFLWHLSNMGVAKMNCLLLLLDQPLSIDTDDCGWKNAPVFSLGDFQLYSSELEKQYAGNEKRSYSMYIEKHM